MLLYWIPVVLLVALTIVSVRLVVIYEYERGLRYQSGRFQGVVHPGSYWILHRFARITRIDMRPTLITVPGQEVIAADGVGLKITVAAKYQITDPAKAVHAIADYQGGLYTLLQLAMRELVAARPAEEVLTSRNEINEKMLELAAPSASAFGIELMEAEIKDVMFPGDLKKVFSQVVRARQEGLAALERARGETAALRNLANAASMLEQRPALMQLRILQALGQEGGNTLVVGLGSPPEIVPISTKTSDVQTSADDQDG